MRRKGNLFLVGVAAAAVSLPAAAGTFYSRERPDGVVEFTNKQAPGKGWKVMFKTGPGKAAATRGSTDIVPPRDTAPARFSRYDRDIRDGQAFYGIPEPFLRAVIKTESDYDPNVVSSAGAQGLMQLLPETAPNPIPIVIPVTGVEAATVFRLSTVTLRSLEACV